MTPEQRKRAGRAISARIDEMTATPATVARAAGISAKTLRAVVRGERWPSDPVQAQLEAVLRWHDGEMTVKAVGGRIDGALDRFTDAELATELARRLTARAKRETRVRASDAG